MTKTSEQPDVDEGFAAFFKELEPRLSYALAAAYGVEVGRECTADAMAYAWEHWNKVREMANPGGYLYRVGQSSARRYRRIGPLFPSVPTTDLPDVEPRLPTALSALSPAQRAALVLVHVLEWSEREAADLLGVDRSTVRRHCERGLAKLRRSMEVQTGV
jgi:DNA-directed RNA polymerase specialized sigma24 family protein